MIHLPFLPKGTAPLANFVATIAKRNEKDRNSHIPRCFGACRLQGKIFL